MNFMVQNGFYILETITIAAFAFSGMLLARKKNLDLMGMAVIAFVTALGGGTLRDLILDMHPVYWISHSEFPIMIIVLSCIGYYFIKGEDERLWLIVLDALGLALFTVSSVQVALTQDLPLIIVAILATCTATFGGLMRDVLCNEIPMLFQKKSVYGLVSFSGAWLYIGLMHGGVDAPIATLVSASAIFVGRLLAVRFNIRFS